MRFAIQMFIASVLVFLAGCAVSPEMHAYNMLQKASVSMTTGDLDSTHRYLASALDTPGQQAQIVAFFADQPERRDMYVKAMVYHINHQMHIPEQVAKALVHIDQGERLRYVSPQEAQDLRQQLIARAQQSNANGTIGFMLRDNLTGLGLDSAKNKEIILKRSLATARSAMDTNNRQTAALMAYASDLKTPAAHKKLIERSLDDMLITKQEMLQFVSPVFPQYADKKLASMTLHAAFVYEGGDRVAREDLLDVVREKIRGVEWLPYGSTGTTIVKIERLRYHEQSARPRTEIIRYTRRQVSYYHVGSKQMPDGSIYSYRLTRSPISIEYGYAVTVLVNGNVVYSEIVRGTEHAENIYCNDAVIRMRSGRIRPAEGPANSDMKNLCSSSESASINELRHRIDNKIADAILAAPPIARIHHLNS